MNFEEFKRKAKMEFAYFYIGHIKKDTAWCDLVLWAVDDAPWENVGPCRCCGYCGKVEGDTVG